MMKVEGKDAGSNGCGCTDAAGRQDARYAAGPFPPPTRRLASDQPRRLVSASAIARSRSRESTPRRWVDSAGAAAAAAAAADAEVGNA